MSDPVGRSRRSGDGENRPPGTSGPGESDGLVADGGVEASSAPPRTTPTADAADGGARGEGATVLHVDDDPLIRDLVSTFFRQSGEPVTVVTERDAVAGLDRVGNGEVDCVVTDLDMPGPDGLALARQLRARHPGLPLIMFTGHGWESVAGEPGADCVDGHVRKSGHDQLAALAEQVRSVL